MATIFFKAGALENPAILEAYRRELKLMAVSASAPNGVVELNNPFATNQEFKELEDLLKENGFPFDRFGNQTADVLQEKRHYRPNPLMDVTMTMDGKGNFEPIVPISSIAEILQRSNVNLRKELEQLISSLDPDIPDLVGNEDDLKVAQLHVHGKKKKKKEEEEEEEESIS